MIIRCQQTGAVFRVLHINGNKAVIQNTVTSELKEIPVTQKLEEIFKKEQDNKSSSRMELQSKQKPLVNEQIRNNNNNENRSVGNTKSQQSESKKLEVHTKLKTHVNEKLNNKSNDDNRAASNNMLHRIDPTKVELQTKQKSQALNIDTENRTRESEQPRQINNTSQSVLKRINGINNRKTIHSSNSKQTLIKGNTTDNDSEDETNEKAKTHWNDNAIRALISAYSEAESEFKKTTKTNDRVWKEIVVALRKTGHSFTSRQVQNKWKHLRKLYMRQVENIGAKATGQSTFTFSYFEEMDEIYSKKHFVKPRSTASSLKGLQVNPDQVETVPYKKRKCPDEKKTPENKKCRTTLELIEKNLAEKEEKQNERHNEFLEVQRQGIRAFSDVMQKLIDKL